MICRDPEFGPVRIRAFGTYEVKVSDPAKFMTEIVGTDGEVTTDEISYQICNIIVSRFSSAIATCGIPVLDMAGNTPELGKHLSQRIAPKLVEFGISLPNLSIENISLPEAVEAALDKRTSMGMVGDLRNFTHYSTAKALTIGAATPGNGGSLAAGMGAGMGIAMAEQMMTDPWGRRGPPAGDQASTGMMPPPLPNAPVEKVWHVAINGKATGPYSRAELARKADDGKMKRDTFVWTVGLDSWKTAGELDELATLFTISPPPAPKS